MTCEEEKYRRLEIAQLLHKFREGNEYLQNLVAIDETWIRDLEPELKSQSSEWRGKVYPRPKKFKRAQSNVKQMIFAYDCKGVITKGYGVVPLNFGLLPSMFAKTEAQDARKQTRFAGNRCSDFA